MNSLMYAGKKAAAEHIVYAHSTRCSRRRSRIPAALHDALRNVSPAARSALAPRLVARLIQVPIEVRTDRSRALAIRWIINAARSRNEPTMTGRLSGELMDAANNRGSAVKKREDTHKMAEANRAFSHYRW